VQRVIYWLGNFLIVFSLAGLVWVFWPVAQLYFQPPPPVPVRSATGTYLAIPKINAVAPVILGVDPWNQAVYEKALQNGVAQAAGTSLPGQPGTMFIFAHSSDWPWRLTRYNTVFFRLGELQAGDEIEIAANGRNYTYEVFAKKVVWPNEVGFLKEKTNQLVLQTCTPIGTAFQRLLVFARPVSTSLSE
jgi:sortase A